uniref:Uncharacterized protein n=1 Tax=Glossina pallidipes TaxID=7398 RepID=A0A1B0AFC7_GLOPL
MIQSVIVQSSQRNQDQKTGENTPKQSRRLQRSIKGMNPYFRYTKENRLIGYLQPFTLSAIPFTRRSDVFLCVIAIVDDEFVVAIQLSLRAYALRNSWLERVQSNRKFSNANYLDYERTAERHQLVTKIKITFIRQGLPEMIQNPTSCQQFVLDQMALHLRSCSSLVSITLFVNNRSDNHVIVMRYEYLKKAAVLFVNRSLLLSEALPKKMHIYAGSPKMTREY